MDEMDNIAGSTSFNGQSLLSGQYTDKKFQIGAYGNESISVNIGATSSDKIGHTRFETGAIMTASSTATLTFKNVDGIHDVKLESVTISTSAGTGMGALAEVINKSSDKTGVKASFNVVTTGSDVIQSGSVKGLSINGISIGSIEDIKANDKDGALVNAINALTDKHGVVASVDERGRLNLTSSDGRGIKITASGATTAGSTAGTLTDDINDILKIGTDGSNTTENYGRLTLTKLAGNDIVVSGTNADKVGFSGNESATTINLRSVKGGFTVDQASAMGVFANANVSSLSAASSGTFGNTNTTGVGIGTGVTTLEGAMATMSIAEAAMKDLNKIRADLGSTQNQLVSTINNISVTQVNVKAAESQIRDVDFAAESANFQKSNILAQAGSYAMSQANQQQQGVMRLLQ
jgi:flagellin